MRKRYLIPILAALMLTGCMSSEEVTGYKTEIEARQAQLETRTEILTEAKNDALAAGNTELANKYDKKAKISEALSGGLDTAAEQLDKIVNEQGEFRTPEEIVGALDPILPVGAGSIALLVIGLFRSLGKQREWKRDFGELVGAIDDTKADNEEFADAMHKAGESLRSRMPSATKAKIKAVRTNGT